MRNSLEVKRKPENGGDMYTISNNVASIILINN